MLSAKKWTKEEIRFKLETNNIWLFRGLLAIYMKQTQDEKIDAITKHENGVGFGGADANILSSFARQYSSNGFLTAKQIDLCRKKMLKYAGQLAKIANGVI